MNIQERPEVKLEPEASVELASRETMVSIWSTVLRELVSPAGDLDILRKNLPTAVWQEISSPSDEDIIQLNRALARARQLNSNLDLSKSLTDKVRIRLHTICGQKLYDYYVLVMDALKKQGKFTGRQGYQSPSEFAGEGHRNWGEASRVSTAVQFLRHLARGTINIADPNAGKEEFALTVNPKLSHFWFARDLRMVESGQAGTWQGIHRPGSSYIPDITSP